MKLDRDGKVVPDPLAAPMIRMMTEENKRRRMPKLRPAVTGPRLDYLKWWISEGAPDGTPPGGTLTKEPEPSVTQAGGTEEEPVTPADPAAPGFAADIAPLFRPEDQDSMSFLIDLTSLDEVRTNATRILDVVGSGRMPCQEADRWPPERVELFRRWVDGGMLP